MLRTRMTCHRPPLPAVLQLYVDEYSPLVFALLEQYLIPDTLCGQVGDD